MTMKSEAATSSSSLQSYGNSSWVTSSTLVTQCSAQRWLHKHLGRGRSEALAAMACWGLAPVHLAAFSVIRTLSACGWHQCPHLEAETKAWRVRETCLRSVLGLGLRPVRPRNGGFPTHSCSRTPPGCGWACRDLHLLLSARLGAPRTTCGDLFQETCGSPGVVSHSAPPVCWSWLQEGFV